MRLFQCPEGSRPLKRGHKLINLIIHKHVHAIAIPTLLGFVMVPRLCVTQLQ